MLNRLRQRASDEGGFTLIELLVVILIIGILAAIAIPAFLSQTKKAYDSSAKTLAQTAQTAAATYATENGGSYAPAGTSTFIAELHTIEPTIPAAGTTNANGPVLAASTTGSASGYTVTAQAQSTGDEFSIAYVVATGETTRTCKIPSASAGTNGCKITTSGGTTGTW